MKKKKKKKTVSKTAQDRGQKKIFVASSLFKPVTILGIPRMGRNFDDYPKFQKNQGL
jgi:hypothetical protein